MRIADTLDMLEEHFLNEKLVDASLRADLHQAVIHGVRVVDQVFDYRYPHTYDENIFTTTATILLFDLFTGHDYKYAIRIYNKMPTMTHYHGEIPLLWDDFDIPDAATFMAYRSLIMEYCLDVLEDAVMEFDRNE